MYNVPITAELTIKAMNDDLPASRRNDIRLYDYGQDENLVSLYYRQAVNQGADVVVGPLGREAASRLLSDAEINIPTILLSPASGQQETSGKVYTYSLSPEQEARQATHTAQREPTPLL